MARRSKRYSSYVLHRNPGLMRFWIDKGKAWDSMDFYNLAASDFQKALALNEALANYYPRIGPGDFARRLRLHKPAVDLSKNALARSSAAYLHAGKATEARDAAQKALLLSAYLKRMSIAKCQIYIGRSWYFQDNHAQHLRILGEATKVFKI